MMCFAFQDWLATPISWKQTHDTVLGIRRKAVVSEGRAASERKSKRSHIGASEDVEVITNIRCINSCMAIPEPILFIGEQLADRMILW